MSAPTIEVVPLPKERQTVEVWRLREARRTAGRGRRGLSIAALAETMGMSRSWIYTVENGTTSISEAQLAAWAKATDVTVDDLYGVGAQLVVKPRGFK